ncbi:battenin-like [Saccostrea echinata]|uniref:battenin-like n=1 Tax=Saccostrea echinata TaxID=191078 RepID=UPI002A813F5D|nr:battenin-like [Saccostrea echinata]
MEFSLRNWIGLFLLGSINNLPYVIVTSAAKTIADSFDKRNDVGVVFGANVALSVLVKAINGLFLLKVPYWIRYVVNAGLMVIGLIGVAFAFDFWFAIVCIVVVGSSAAFGENVALGYLRLFPSKSVNAWSSGTGMAGILGSAIYIIFGCSIGESNKTSQLKTLTKYAFLLTLPAVAVYLIAYFFVIKAPKEDDTVRRKDVQDPLNEEKRSILQDTDSENTTFVPKESVFRRLRRCWGLVWWLSLNLCAVYLFEYVAQGCAAKVRPKSEYNKGCPELFAALSFCYQSGVFASRSSVQLFQIKRVEILSFLQFLNMILWIIDVHYKFIPVYILPALMIYVGLLGGASYVNIFYLLLHEEKYPEEDREFCINITSLFITGGIVLGTGLETALFNTVLKSD